MAEYAKRLDLGHFPTPIQYMETLSESFGHDIYIKRDDYSGTDISGNKIRKLEYVLADAIGKGADCILTTGAAQSNHCRATASACARLGLECHLLLRGTDPDHAEGNLFQDYAYGAQVHFYGEPGDFDAVREALVTELEGAGKTVYYIPVGASNAVGSQGYRRCFAEILDQEAAMGLEFDLICLAVGSGGTYAGLHYENAVRKAGKTILGISVSASAEDFRHAIAAIEEAMNAAEEKPVKLRDEILINDEYIGPGYAKTTPEELRFLMDMASKTGILFDPCYTGKGLFGLISEICKNHLQNYQRILFIHTGGLSGWTSDFRDEAMKEIAYLQEEKRKT